MVIHTVDVFRVLTLLSKEEEEEDTVEDHRQKIGDSRQLSGIDSTPSAQGSSEEQTDVLEATPTPDQPHLDDMSSQNQRETANEGMDQHPKIVSNYSTVDVLGTSGDISSCGKHRKVYTQIAMNVITNRLCIYLKLIEFQLN